MRNRIYCAAVIAAAVGIWCIGGKPAVGQTLIGGFENSLSSPVGANWEGRVALNQEYTTTGATQGTSAIAIHHPGSWSEPYPAILKGGMSLAQAVSQNDFLQIDFTTKDLGVAGDGMSPGFRQVFVIFNSNQGGWQQNQLDFPVAADDGGSHTETATLDLVATGIKANAQAFVDAGVVPNTYWELFLQMQGNDVGVVKAGDYSADNIVNAADYVTWRDNLGGTTLTNETVTPGSVDPADYDEWKAKFGNDYSTILTIIDNVRLVTAGSGSLAATGVPEPTSAVLAVLAMSALVAGRRVRNGSKVQKPW